MQLGMGSLECIRESLDVEYTRVSSVESHRDDDLCI